MNNILNFLSSNKWVKFITVYLTMISCGVFFAFLMSVVVSSLFVDDSAGFGALGIIIATALLSYPVGAILAVFFLKRRFGYRGSFLRGVVATIIGTAVMILLLNVLDESLNLSSDSIFGLYYLVIPLVSLTGYRYKSAKK